MVQLKQVAVSGKEGCHTADLECILLHEDLVYTAADDGKVKIWNKDLVLQKDLQAHDYAVYHLLIMDDRLFTASVDSTIKVWRLPSLELEATLTSHEEPVRRLATDGARLYSGDERGDVIRWDTATLTPLGRYETVEEVWDLATQDNYFLNVRDRGVFVTDIKDGHSNQFSVVKSLQGRAPLYLSRQHLVFGECGTGFGLHLHKCQYNEFPKIADLRGHDMIITCLGGSSVSGGGERIASSGYDKKVNLWELPSGKLLSTLVMEVTPSCVAVAGDSTVYVGGPDGYLVKLAV